MAIDWHKKVKDTLKSAEKVWLVLEENEKAIADALTNAQKFIQLHRQLAPRQKQYAKGLKDCQARMCEIAAEASVYVDDLKEAKKAKDRAKVKTLEGKLKNLEASYKEAKAEFAQNRDDAVSENQKLAESAQAVASPL